MSKSLKVVGLMSGTSLDGVDAALLETDGERVNAFGPALTLPYTPEQRQILRHAIDAAMGEGLGAAAADAIRKAEALLTATHAEAVRRVLLASSLKTSDIQLVGFHGQTLVHRPHQRLTWQIGDAKALADDLGVDVIFDFRSADAAAGGQGAPLVPLYHQALVAGLRTELPIAVLNIGGVSNVTYVGNDDVLIAFDTGPGNAPIDDWSLTHTGRPFDEDGQLANRGQVEEKILAEMLRHEWFSKTPPKSLDRLDFGIAAVRSLSAEDGAATLTAFTAAATAQALHFLPEQPKRWIVCGGGRRNPVLMRELRKRLGISVEPVESVGWRGDFLEAEAFAFLAVRSLYGLPISTPTTTGVAKPMSGGKLQKAGGR